MTNKERQKHLDKQKYLTSEIYKRDLSGEMSYCNYCKYKNCTNHCIVPQKEREEKSLCSTAYNRMDKAKKNNGVYS